MKAILLLSTLAGAALLSGCASTAPSASAPAAAPQQEHRGDRGSWNETPSVGMTREAVLARYGDPDSVQQTAKGEVWSYRAKVRGKDFIPMYGAFTQQRKGGQIGFDTAGRVAAYDWGTTRWGTWW